MSTKAIVVHENINVHQWVGSLHPDWDVQIPINSVEGLWDSLDNAQISQESQILFISDLLFQSTPEDFSILVAQFAPSLLVIIMVEDATLMDSINQGIEQARVAYELEPSVYFYLDTASADPLADIDNIIEQYNTTYSPAAKAAEQPQQAPTADLSGLDGFDPMQPNSQHVSPPVEDVQLGQPEAAPSFSSPAPAPAAPSVNVPPVTQQPNPAPQPAPAFQQPAPQPAPAVPDFAPKTDTTYEGFSQEEIASITNSLGEPGLVFASTSSKGGSGKTTNALCLSITISLASQLASQQGSGYPPLKVALVDMDVRDGQIGLSINQTSPSILTLYVGEDNKSQEMIAKNMISVPRFGIDCLLAPKRGRTADYIAPQFYLDTIRQLRLMYDLVILDTSVNYLDPLLSQVVYPEADAILFVTNLSKGAVLGMPRWMGEVTADVEAGGAGIDKDKIGVVINQSLGGVGMDLDLVRKAAGGAPLLVAIPADNRAITKASNEGTLNELIRKHETIGAEYFKLAKKVWKRTPLVSPLEDYLNSEEKQRDDALAARGRSEESNAVSTFTPLSQADIGKGGSAKPATQAPQKPAAPKRFSFGRK